MFRFSLETHPPVSQAQIMRSTFPQTALRQPRWWILPIRPLLLVAVAFWICIGRSHGSEIRGEAFMVEPNQDVSPLALMGIGIYREEDMADFVSDRRALADKVVKYFSPFAASAGQLFAEAEDAAKAHEKTDPKRRDFELRPDGAAEFERAVFVFRKSHEILQKALSEAGTKSDYARGLTLYPRTGAWYFEQLPKPLVSVDTDSDGRFRLDAPDGSYVLVSHAEHRTEGGSEDLYWMVRLEVKGETRVTLSNGNTTDHSSKQSLIGTVADPERLGRRALGGHRFHWLVALTEPAIVAEAAAAQARAMLRYPPLATPGSRLNHEFLKRLEEYKADRAEFLSKADWPLRVADESAAVLGVIPRK